METSIKEAIAENLEGGLSAKESIGICLDAMTGGEMPEQSLAEHDRVFHKKGFKKGTKCKYRERLAAALGSDDVEDARPKRKGKSGGGKGAKEAIVESLDFDPFDDVEYADDPPKRQRGRPRKDEQEKAEEKGRYGFGRRAKRELDAEQTRKVRMLEPKAETKEKRLEELTDRLSDLRSDGLDDYPMVKAEEDELATDLRVLAAELGDAVTIKSLPETKEYEKAFSDYRVLCKDTDAKIRTVKKLLGMSKESDFVDAEEILDELDHRQEEIESAYKRIYSTHDALSKALCERIEGSLYGEKADKGTDEGERQQFGTLHGEDGKAYMKRMKSNGREKEIPATIRNIDRQVERAERRWQRIAALSPDEMETVKRNWKKTIDNLMLRSALATNIGPMGLEGVLTGHLKSQHELTKKGKRFEGENEGAAFSIIGGMEDGPRYRFTRNQFGTDKGMDEGEYEKYGCLHSKTPVKDDNLTGGQYGSNVIRWKPESVVATFFCGDSLCLQRDSLNYCNCSLLSNPSPASFNPENTDLIDELKKGALAVGLEGLNHYNNAPYIELQFHGRDNMGADAVESISFGNENDARNLSPTAIAAIRENGIVVYLRNKEVEISEDGTLRKKRRG